MSTRQPGEWRSVMRVSVIGAGFAGLAAAEALSRDGAEVIVLEAGERVGGRVWSERLPGGGLVERGGEFVTAGYDTLAALAADHGLQLDGMGINYPDRESVPDQGLDRGELLSAADDLVVAARAAPDSAASEVLANTVPDARVRDLFALRVQSAVAYPFDELAARWLTRVPGLLESGETRRIRGGNQLLAERLNESLSAPARLGVTARAIHHDADGVTVNTDGGEIRGDGCVVAVPCRLVGEIEFQPALPAAVAMKLEEIRMSSAAKLAVELHEPRQPRALMSTEERYWAWTTPCDGVGGRVVGSWAGSHPVLRDLAVEERDPAVWLRRLGELWPQLSMNAASALLTVWDRSSWPGGAYSVLGTEAQEPRNAGSPRVVFAGEHTAGEWSATMEGALRSGKRAAEDLIRDCPLS